MRFFVRARILGGAMLVALVALLAGPDLVVAVAPPDRKAPNKPWDKMVREIVTAQGGVDKPGPAVYFLANGPSVDKITDNVTKLFLGVQLQCAQCHNHPFTDWKQTEYWGMAAFFMKVRTNGNP